MLPISTDYAPGPIDLGDLPLGPRVFHDGLFEQLVEPLAGVLAGSDGPLASLQTTIAGNTEDGLEGTWQSTIGAADDLAANQAGLGDDQTADALVDAGAGTEAYRQSVLRYLPQPDAPIQGDFRDLPQPPAGAPGGTGGGDPNPTQD